MQLGDSTMARCVSRTFLALIYAGGILAVATAIMADRLVTYTLVTATRADVTEVQIVRANGGVRVTATYTIKDTEGKVRVEGGAVEVVLTGPQATQLVSFLDGVVVPAINAQEDL